MARVDFVVLELGGVEFGVGYDIGISALENVLIYVGCEGGFGKLFRKRAVWVVIQLEAKMLHIKLEAWNMEHLNNNKYQGSFPA